MWRRAAQCCGAVAQGRSGAPLYASTTGDGDAGRLMRCDPMASGRVGTSDLREAYEIEGGLDAHVYLEMEG